MVSWSSGDHSAVTTQEAGWYISKWNEFPLIKHRWDDSPYGTADLKYYVKSSISGPTTVCSSNATFTLNNLPAAHSVSWSRSSNLTYVSGQGTVNYTVKAASPTTSGSGWVRATVSGPCGDVVLPQHDLWIGAPSSLTRINGFPNNGMLFGSSSYYNFSVSPPNIQGVTQYDWIVFGGTILSGQGTNSILVLTGIGSDESPLFFDVNVRAGNPCGFSSWFWRTGYVVGGVGPIRQGQSLTVSPNPASGNFTVSEVEPANNNMSWILCLMSQQGAVMVNVTTTLPKTINVQGLQPGVYLLHARQGEYVEQLRVVVE
ncbi:MAG TPA: T9SS type A sorting domain-containing protein [Tenuifilaceae bacterium]|nr:T9SS type A sorting domain-containing protein [Tenuifilaceae bacterium]